MVNDGFWWFAGVSWLMFVFDGEFQCLMCKHWCLMLIVV